MIPIASGAILTRRLIASEFLGPNALHSQLIRWKRKPIWLGTAKSKIFRVPTRPVIPLDESLEIQRLSNNYRTYRESIRKYYMKLTTENAVQFDEETVKLAEIEDFERCTKLNDEWNMKVAESREARRKAEMEEREQTVLQNIMAKQERDRMIMEEIEEKVRKAKVESVTFITEKNIDEAIEAALAEVVDYNVAIDSEGNRYDGKYVPPEKEATNERRFQRQQ